MAAERIVLKWEWPAGRQVGSRVLVKVKSIKPAARGLFGIGASPSMADALPDATELVAEVEAGPDALQGRQVSLRLPGIEAKKLIVGSYAALGLVGSDQICICVDQAPTAKNDDARHWISSWKCPG